MGFASEMLCGGAVLMLTSLALREPVTALIAPSSLAAWAYRVVCGSLIAFERLPLPAGPREPRDLGVLFGGVHLTGGEWIACGVVLAGVVLIFTGKSRGALQ